MQLGADSLADSPPTATAEATKVVRSETPAPVPSPTSTPAPVADGADSDEPYVADGSIDDDLKRMNVTLGGKTYNIKNDGKIVLRDGYEVEVFVDPFPPSTLRTWMDL